MRILLGDGQKSFLQLMQQRFFGQFEFDWAKDVPSLNSLVVQRAYALIILAMDVPFEDRMRLVEQCRQVSDRSAIMVISEPVPVHERVQALEAGVDDYVMRPVHVDEFAARAKALVRRASATQSERVRVGNLELTEAGDLFLAGKRVDLQLAEQKVLSILARRSGRVVSKSMLDRAITGSDGEELSSNAIEQRMSRLRRILDAQNSSVRITTIRGSGYMLEPLARSETTLQKSDGHVITDSINV